MFEASFHEYGFNSDIRSSVMLHGPCSAARVSTCYSVLSTLLVFLTFKQTDERITSRTTIQPECDWIIGRIIPRLKEPEEAVHIRCQVDEACIGVDAWGSLTDTRLTRLFVADVHTIGADDGLHVGRFCGQLSFPDLELRTLVPPIMDHRTWNSCGDASNERTPQKGEFDSLHGKTSAEDGER